MNSTPNSLGLESGHVQRRPGKGAWCCREYWCGIFRGFSWYLVAFNLFIGFAYNFFCFLWILITFAVSLAFVPLGVGLFLLMWSMISWRWLARLNLKLQRTPHKPVGIQDKTPLTAPLCRDVIGEAADYNWCSCFGVWQAIKITVGDGETWKVLFYFVFIGFPLAIFNFVWTLLWVSVSFGLMGNIAIKRYVDWWGDLDKGDESYSWILDKDIGSIVTIPVGIFFLFYAIFTTVGMARLQADAAYTFLEKAAMKRPRKKRKKRVHTVKGLIMEDNQKAKTPRSHENLVPGRGSEVKSPVELKAIEKEDSESEALSSSAASPAGAASSGPVAAEPELDEDDEEEEDC